MKHPPTHPDFDLLTSITDKPLCTTYIRCLPSMQSDISFIHSNSFLGTLISFPNCPALTIYNFYSPGRPHAVADLLPNFHPTLPTIIMGDLNAYHPWGAVPAAWTTPKSISRAHKQTPSPIGLNLTASFCTTNLATQPTSPEMVTSPLPSTYAFLQAASPELS
jgi:hypothetical protein